VFHKGPILKSTQLLEAFSVDVKAGYPNILKAAKNICRTYGFK
jgi:hypothetical protein